MKIMEQIDQVLRKRDDEGKTRERSGLYSPSSFGRCFRYQYWHRMNEPASNPPDAHALRVFMVGKVLHKWLQDEIKGVFPTAETEVEVTTASCHTFVDVVLDDEAIEIKTTHPWALKHMEKEGFSLMRDQKPHMLQAIHGAMATDKDHARLLYLDRQNLWIKEFYITLTGELVHEVDMELNQLNAYWDKQELPAAEQRCFGGKECEKYCNYRDKCYKERGL